MTCFSHRTMSRAKGAGCALLAGGLLPLALVLAQTPAATQVPDLAQLPLRNLAQVPVKPNLMVTLDDSASMGLQYLPDGKSAVVGTWTIDVPAAGRGMAFHPLDALTSNMSNAEGLLPSDPQTPYWQQRAMRSPDVNPLYYNPEVRYRPWLRADGTRYPQADITQAAVNPNYPTGDPARPPNDPAVPDSNRIDLTQSLSAYSGKWCIHTMADCTQISARAYTPGLYYRLQRDAQGFRDPKQAVNYVEFDVNAKDGPMRGPGRMDCAGAQCTQAEEQQNFANWFVYYRSRLYLARAALGEALLSQGNRVRVGYGRLGARLVGEPVDGQGSYRMIVSGVRDWDLAQKRQFADWLYQAPTFGGTPLVRATKEVGAYYERSDSPGPWGKTPGMPSTEVQASCRRAYQLMITDGKWSEPAPKPGTVNIDSTPGPVVVLENGATWQYRPTRPYMGEGIDFLSDAALSYWYRDLRPDLPNKVLPRTDNEATWQSMSTYIVGLGVQGLLDPATDLPALTAGTKSWGGDHIDDLWHAALNSRGAYFSAFDTEALRKSLRDSFASITRQDQSQAGVVAASADAGAGNRRYSSVYRSGDWSGDLLAAPLGGGNADATGAWSAERALPRWDQRRIFIWDDGLASPAAVPFVPGSLSTSLQSAIAAEDVPAVVNFLRGDRSREGDIGWRVRGGLLGDFINSTPVVAGDAADPELATWPDADKSYARYLDQVKKNRPRVVYAGSNDGMLHAFRDAPGTDGSPAGREIFAYIPRAVANDLKRLRDPDYALFTDRHRYFVDGPLRLADVQAPPPGGGPTTWRNYLLGSTGAGPSAVFALDVTAPSALGSLTPRWELRGATETRLGHVLAPLATGLLPNGKWVAMFGNGFGSTFDANNPQAHLFVIELGSGIVHTLALPAAAQSNGLGGVALRKNGQGQVVGAYAGDLAGRLWRFDYSENDAAFFRIGLGGQPLFQAPAGQAIMQAPWLQSTGQGFRLAFGTGRLITDEDAKDRAVQAVYVVEDREGESLSRPLLPEQLEVRVLSALPQKDAPTATTYYQVSNPAIDWTRKRGWSLNLTGPDIPQGLRVLQPLQSVTQGSDLLLVAAEAPAVAGDPCDVAQGAGVNLLLKAAGGPASTRPILDTNGDGVVNSSDLALAVGYRTMADGADAILLGGSSSGTGAGGSPASGTTGGGATSTCSKQLQLVGSAGSQAGCMPGDGVLKARVWRRILQPPF